MKAAIDIGSNTTRMLVGEMTSGQLCPFSYSRIVTRLGSGNYLLSGLSMEGMERTLSALQSFSQTIKALNVDCVRAVATEAVRRAANGQNFSEEIFTRTGIPVEIINGEEEAELSSSGVFAALHPPPLSSLIFDIGGGSTEFMFSKGDKLLWKKSYPLGVISLAEDHKNIGERINRTLDTLQSDLQAAGLEQFYSQDECELIGTAGTVTTLAAVDLAMSDYDWQRINNHLLTYPDLLKIYERFLSLSPAEREEIIGVEKGRGDLILPGIEIVLALLQRFSKQKLRVSDFGLLEGILLSFY